MSVAKHHIRHLQSSFFQFRQRNASPRSIDFRAKRQTMARVQENRAFGELTDSPEPIRDNPILTSEILDLHFSAPPE